MLTKDAVVRASLELGQQVGEEGLTMRALAARLGVSATSLYNLFESKESILSELRVGAWDILADALAPVEQIASRPERLRAMCRTYLAFARRNPWLYTLAMSASLFDDLDDRDSDRALGPSRVAIAAMRKGAPPDQTEATLRLAVVDVWASLHGLAMLLASGRVAAYLQGDHDPDAFAERYIDALVSDL